MLKKCSITFPRPPMKITYVTDTAEFGSRTIENSILHFIKDLNEKECLCKRAAPPVWEDLQACSITIQNVLHKVEMRCEWGKNTKV